MKVSCSAALITIGMATGATAELRPADALLPTLAVQGPYGLPLTMSPRPASVSSDPSGLAASDLRAPRVGDADPKGSGARAGLEAPRAAASVPTIPLPGMFKPEPVAIPDPTPFLEKKRALGPHLTPDAEVARLGRNTSIGAFGGVEGVDLKTGAGLVPSMRARDLGAGLTVQYRFGQ